MKRPRRVLGAMPVAAPPGGVWCPAGTDPATMAAASSASEAKAATFERADRVPFTLLRRAGCALCDDFEYVLRELDEAGRIGLRHIDIDDEPRWRERYDEAVPVLLHADREVCRHFPDWEAVSAVVAAYNERLGVDPVG